MIQMLCEKITGHRWNKLEGWADREPVEYYYRCRICREAFWNYKPPTRKRDIERLERWRRQEARHD